MTSTHKGQQLPTALGRCEVLAVYAGLMLAMAVAALDLTILAAALPTIVGELGGLAHVGWVATAAAVINGKAQRPARP